MDIEDNQPDDIDYGKGEKVSFENFQIKTPIAHA